ncbi:hypothetical protein MTO96_001324 [Rhipicephalus appendiculatus]
MQLLKCGNSVALTYPLSCMCSDCRFTFKILDYCFCKSLLKSALLTPEILQSPSSSLDIKLSLISIIFLSLLAHLVSISCVQHFLKVLACIRGTSVRLKLQEIPQTVLLTP